jgi:hypothetical protein
MTSGHGGVLPAGRMWNVCQLSMHLGRASWLLAAGDWEWPPLHCSHWLLEGAAYTAKVGQKKIGCGKALPREASTGAAAKPATAAS